MPPNNTTTPPPSFKISTPAGILKGQIASFDYLYWKHDAKPLIICSSNYADGKVAGVNLHYLTFRYIKYLISQYCNKQFSYSLIKGNIFIANSFRTYKKEGIRNVKIIDCQFLNSVLGIAKSLNPSEMEAVRQEIERQLRERMQPNADELTKDYFAALPNQKFNLNKQTLDDGRKNPTGILPVNDQPTLF